jgi:hypothetical protein
MKMLEALKAFSSRRTYQEAIATVLAASLASASTVFVMRQTSRISIDWHLTAETVAHFATALAVLIAGVWALYTTLHRRSLAPRAELSHQYQLWNHQDGEALRIFIELRNPSEAMLIPGDGMTHVQIPPTTALGADYANEAWSSIAKIRHPMMYEGMRIDPKEVEVFVHDVSIPAGIRYLQLHTWVLCDRIDQGDSDGDERPTAAIELPDEDETWSRTTLIDLEPIRNDLRTPPRVRPFARCLRGSS